MYLHVCVYIHTYIYIYVCVLTCIYSSTPNPRLAIVAVLVVLRVLLAKGLTYGRSPKVGNPIASILKSNIYIYIYIYI